jgi:hypothetical protein
MEKLMAMAGRKPADRPTVTRHKPTVDWTEVVNVTYDGTRPELPTSRMVMNPKGELQEFPVESRTRDWWEAITTMPHCVLWQPSDWQFALDTAMVHADACHGKTTAMGELRQREKIMGTTVDARRDLRIRYVEPESETPQIAAVANIVDRRQKLLDA